MRAKVGHPVLREVVARITEHTLERKRNGRLDAYEGGSLNIIEWTGPAVWTDSVFWGMNREARTGKGTKPGGDAEEWSWVQFTGITEPKVSLPQTLNNKLFSLDWADCSKLGIYLFYRSQGFRRG